MHAGLSDSFGTATHRWRFAQGLQIVAVSGLLRLHSRARQLLSCPLPGRSLSACRLLTCLRVVVTRLTAVLRGAASVLGAAEPLGGLRSGAGGRGDGFMGGGGEGRLGGGGGGGEGRLGGGGEGRLGGGGGGGEGRLGGGGEARLGGGGDAGQASFLASSSWGSKVPLAWCSRRTQSARQAGRPMECWQRICA